MEPETEVVTAPTPQAPELSLQQRMAESVAAEWPGATVDSATVATPSAEVPVVAVPAGVESAPVETAPAAEVAAQDDTPYTPEQLKDSATWGRLQTDADWERMERLHPLETKLYKATQAAASRLMNKTRQEVAALKAGVTPETPTSATQPAPEEPADLSPEEQALLDAIEVGTPRERFNAQVKIAQMAVSGVPEIQSTREREKRAELMQQARDLAVKGDEEAGLPPFPELEDFDDATLNAAYAKDPVARAMAKIGTPQAIALAARRLGETLLEQKKASIATFEREQEKIRRNANTPVSNAVVSGAGGPIPSQPESKLQFVQGQWGQAAVKASQ